MTKDAIIAKYRLFIDDTSDLSDQEESDLFDKVYQELMSDRPWEILKVSYAGTQSTTVPYVALPSDFGYLTQNHNYTQDNQYSDRPVVFVGTNYDPYSVINFSDRRQYRNQSGYAYIDIVNSRLYFTKQPTTANAIEYDYCKVPAALTGSGSPVFPARFHDILYHLMVTDGFIIQQSEKAKSYAGENMERAEQIKQQMAFWNAQLVQIT
jgi:hypothetical protein